MENTQPKTAADVLRAAKKLIETKGWTQGEYAKNAQGVGVFWGSPDAACFCGHGAVNAVTPAKDGEVPTVRFLAGDLLDRVVVDPHVEGYFPSFNDAPGRTKEEVLAKFDEAIALAEADHL